MRITLVSSGSGSHGGGEIYLTFLAEGLASLGHEVQALVPEAARMDPLAEQLAAHATVTRFAFRTTYERRLRTLGAWLDRAQQADLSKRFAALDTDILHLNQQVAEDGLDLVQAAVQSGRPWLSTIHVARSAEALGARFGALRDRLTARVLGQAAGDHIAVCGAGRDQLAARFGTGAPLRLHSVPNGVPVQDDSALAAARAAARAEWGVQPNEVVIGAVGRIAAQKDPLAFVDHVASLKLPGAEMRVGTPLRLIWIGDGALRGALEAQAAPFADRMPLVIDGWRSDAALRLAGFDIYALPSRFEGLPLALLEAMLGGRPCIANQTDGIGEALRDGETGFLCDTAADWSNALFRLVKDDALRERMGTAAQQDARARFSTEAMARATAKVYGTVLARQAEAAAPVPMPVQGRS